MEIDFFNKKISEPNTLNNFTSKLILIKLILIKLILSKIISIKTERTMLIYNRL